MYAYFRFSFVEQYAINVVPAMACVITFDDSVVVNVIFPPPILIDVRQRIDCALNVRYQTPC
jgi:hypothetical protein